MAMDVLRVGRVQPARCHRDDPSRITKLRWYKCAEGAQIFPSPHCFGFTAWLDPERFAGQPIGFTGQLGTWDSGLNHGQQGQEFHGSAHWFLYGIPTEADATDARCIDWQGAFPGLVAMDAGWDFFEWTGQVAMLGTFDDNPELFSGQLGLIGTVEDAVTTVGGSLALSGTVEDAEMFSGARAHSTVAQSVPGGGEVAAVFGAIDWDTDHYFDFAIDHETLTAPFTGIFLVYWSIDPGLVIGDATIRSMFAFLNVNGVNLDYAVFSAGLRSGDNTNWPSSGAVQLHLTAGDLVQVSLGSNTVIGGAFLVRTMLGAEYRGPLP